MSLRAIVLGAGEGVGLSVIRKLTSEGFKVAAVSRNPNLASATDIGYHPIKFDLGNFEKLSETFIEAEKELGGFPNVVVYNAWAATFPKNSADWVSEISPDSLAKDFRVNTISLYAAAQLALAGWSGLGSSVPRAFIFTGNPLPWVNIPSLVSLAVGKSASATLIQSLAATYGKDGKRFYFTQQVSETDGISVNNGIDGPQTADIYWDLIKRESQGGWKISFDKNLKLWES